MKALAAAAAALALGGCVHTTQPVAPATQVAQVQQLAVQVCGFLPTADFVLDLFVSKDNAMLQNASTWATAICNAVTAQPKASGRTTRARARPTVNGVVVEGRFV